MTMGTVKVAESAAPGRAKTTQARKRAARAHGLLGTGTDVQWLLPRPGARQASSDKHLDDLIPRWLNIGYLIADAGGHQWGTTFWK